MAANAAILAVPAGGRTALSMDSESALIRRAAAGDPAAFESLFRSHQGRVYGLCLRMTGSAQVAEDCMQEAFVRAWSKLDRFRGDSSFATWMHRIAVNEVLGWQRREGRRGQHLELFEEALNRAMRRAERQMSRHGWSLKERSSGCPRARATCLY